MSVLGPMYDIPATIRCGLDYFNRFKDKEVLQSCLGEIREMFNKSASESSIEQLNANLDYMNHLSEHIFISFNFLIDLGVEIPIDEDENEVSEGEEINEVSEEQVSEKEYTPEQKFLRHVLKDYEESLKPQAYLLSSLLKIVEIGKEELSKYLPDNPDLSGSEKVLSQNLQNK